MAIVDIKGCSLIDGEVLFCAQCGGGWVRQPTEHLQKKAAAGRLNSSELPCGGLQTAVEAASKLPIGRDRALVVVPGQE